MPPSTPSTGSPPRRSFSPAWVDVVFQRLLTEHPHLLHSMLNAVLQPAVPIVECEILSPIVGDDDFGSKDIKLDLRVRLADHTQIDVEMQSSTPPGVATRVLYYWARMHSTSLRRGDPYIPAPRSISILWSRRELFPDPQFHHIFRVLNQRGRALNDELAIHVLELSHLGLAQAEGASPALCRWARLLLAESEIELQDLACEDPTMNEASRALHELHRDPDFVTIAELRRDAAIGFLIEKAAEREIGLELGKEIGREEGKELGLRLGKEIGREIGLEQGREVGREEGLQRGLTGQRKLMIDVLELRFGRLSDEQVSVVLTADAATLERWISIVTTAPSLGAVFSPR